MIIVTIVISFRDLQTGVTRIDFISRENLITFYRTYNILVSVLHQHYNSISQIKKNYIYAYKDTLKIHFIKS